jgi:hypothetical protein
MKYLLEKRFNFIDSVAISAMCIYISQGNFKMALVAACVGALVNIIAQIFYGKWSMDRQWQKMTRERGRVLGIKMHRELYNSSLRDALEAVTQYEARIKK